MKTLQLIVYLLLLIPLLSSAQQYPSLSENDRSIMFKEGESASLGNEGFLIPVDVPLQEVRIYHENDLLRLFKNKEQKYDDNYTGGFQMEIVSREVKIGNLKFSPFFKFKKDNTKTSSKVSNYQTFGIGMTVFTPDSIRWDTVILDDRPYGSFQYFTFGKTSVLRLPRKGKGHQKFIEENKGKFRQISTTWYLGLIGGQFPGRFQNYIHRKITPKSPNPEGWDFQISQMPVINLNISYEGLMTAAKNKMHLNRNNKLRTYNHFYTTLIAKVNLGNYKSSLSGGFGFYLFNINERSTFYNPTEQFIGTYTFDNKEDLMSRFEEIAKVHPLYKGKERDTTIRYPGNYETGENLIKSDSSLLHKRKNINDSLITILEKELNYLSDKKKSYFERDIASIKLQNKRLDSIAKKISSKKQIKDVYLKYENGFSFQTFVRTEFSAIPFNSMLQGNLFRDKSVHTLGYRDINPFLIDAEVGINLTLFKGFRTKYSMMFRGQEFVGGKDIHIWGSIGFFINAVALKDYFKDKRRFKYWKKN